jgi:putative flippase GtrA
MLRTKKTFVEIVKYGSTGTLNFLIGLGFYWLLVNIFKIDYRLAFLINWIIGMLITYSLNLIWVFKHQTKLEFKTEFLKFLIIYCSSFLFNFLILQYIVEKYKTDPLFTQIALLPAIVVYNFLGMKLWSFKSNN